MNRRIRRKHKWKMPRYPGRKPGHRTCRETHRRFKAAIAAGLAPPTTWAGVKASTAFRDHGSVDLTDWSKNGHGHAYFIVVQCINTGLLWASPGIEGPPNWQPCQRTRSSGLTWNMNANHPGRKCATCGQRFRFHPGGPDDVACQTLDVPGAQRMNTPKKPRRVPRIPTEEAMHDESSAKHWDHLGSGTVPPPFCRWGARGMRCDCLICAETMTTTKSPEVIATMEHYRRDVLLPCGHVAVLRLSAAISTLAKPVADVPVKELARRGAEERFDQAVKGINGIKCPECGRVSSPERYNRPVER